MMNKHCRHQFILISETATRNAGPHNAFKFQYYHRCVFVSTYPCNGMPTLRFRLLKLAEPLVHCVGVHNPEVANAGIVTINLLRARFLCVQTTESCFPPSHTWTAAWCGHWQWLSCLVYHGETCKPSPWKLRRISNAPVVLSGHACCGFAPNASRPNCNKALLKRLLSLCRSGLQLSSSAKGSIQILNQLLPATRESNQQDQGRPVTICIFCLAKNASGKRNFQVPFAHALSSSGLCKNNL